MLPSRVAVAISLHHVFESGERVVVAVSGGPDSLALLSILREILPVVPLHLTVAHFDHGWRSDSTEDRDFVASMAEQWGFEVHSARVADDTPHTENAARAARYAFLRQIAAATNSTAIALGHTQDDQVETLLLHLLRGSGSRGLSGMRRRDGDLARPLLDISRREIEAYLTRLHLVPRRDPSNDDPRFTRNRLRQQLLPAIDAFDPAARELLARAADILGEEDRYLDDEVATLPPTIATDRDAFARLPPALQRRVIRRLIPDAGFVEIEAARLAPSDSLPRHTGQPTSSGSRDFPRGQGPGLPAHASRRGVAPREPRFSAMRALETSERAVPAFEASGAGLLTATTCNCDPRTFKARDRIGHLDADLVQLPLTVATRKPGDRMRPLGLATPKRLQDILVDAHVPRHVRDTLPVVSDRDEIVWIPGVTVAETKRVTAGTRRQLHLEIARG